MCNRNQTLMGTRFEKRLKDGVGYAPPVGNRPRFQPLDSNLNADWARMELHLCALTTDLENDDVLKCSLATPAQASKTMRAAWESAPTMERIVQDILRFLGALQDVLDVDGAMVLNEQRRGRRANLILPVPPAYQQVLADRLSKYRRWYNEHGDSYEDSDSNEED